MTVMDAEIEDLLIQYERGHLSRRKLLTAMSLLTVAAPAAVSAAESIDKAAEPKRADVATLHVATSTEIVAAPTLKYEASYLFSRRSIVRREVIGAVGEGFRIDIITEGGQVRGPALNGVCGHGGDWFTVRRDGVGVVDSRVTLHADDGAVIDTFYSGVVDLGEDAFERLTKGEALRPGAIHIAARFQTSAPRYAWLNRIQAFGIGRSDPSGNLWDTYALR